MTVRNSSSAKGRQPWLLLCVCFWACCSPKQDGDKQEGSSSRLLLAGSVFREASILAMLISARGAMAGLRLADGLLAEMLHAPLQCNSVISNSSGGVALSVAPRQTSTGHAITSPWVTWQPAKDSCLWIVLAASQLLNSRRYAARSSSNHISRYDWTFQNVTRLPAWPARNKLSKETAGE